MTHIIPLDQLIRESYDELRSALPKYLTPERMIRIALTTLRMSPKLYECQPKSFLACLFQAAQLGLEPSSSGECYFIPYQTKQGWLAQFQIGYQGMIKLFWNHPDAASIKAEVVYDTDNFEHDLANGTIKHSRKYDKRKKILTGKPIGKPIGYYSIVKLKNGNSIVELMTYDEVMEHAIRFSKCYSKKDNRFIAGTPWAEHFDAMALKTVIKKLYKLLPKSVEMIRALQWDETARTDIDNNPIQYNDIVEAVAKEEQQPKEEKQIEKSEEKSNNQPTTLFEEDAQ